MTYLEYLNNISDKKSTNKLLGINESFDIKDIDKVMKLVTTILSRHISQLMALPGFAHNDEGGQHVWSKQYIVGGVTNEPVMFQINFLNTNTTNNAYSIDFFDNLELLFNGKAKADLTISTLGSSLVYFLPVIWTVANSHDYQLSASEAISIGRTEFDNGELKESAYYVGSLAYRMVDGMSQQAIDEAFATGDKSLASYKQSKLADMKQAFIHRYDSDDAADEYERISKEYDEVKRAIRGGATSIDELKAAVSHSVKVVDKPDEEIEQRFKNAKQDHEDPNKVFKKLEAYVNMVINGQNPSLIICGAPGVGKTYRVRKALKEHGYEEGKNLYTIKGKCSTRALYVALYNYKSKGDIILIDDADGLVGPKAPEECINILKSALDSTEDEEGRLVSYDIAGKIFNNNGQPLPKRMYYNGSVIVLTNYNAGQLNTALRGRSFLQDINFTVADVLSIIRDLMPAIDPENLSEASKMKAYKYLSQLVNEDAEMEVSLRTFGICARIYEACSDTDVYDESSVESMISEQMKLQAQRGGKQY